MAESLISDDNLNRIKTWLGSGSINIFGLPYAGKDTHGTVLSELFDAPLIGGGEILRNSVLSPDLQKGQDAGKLFPQDEYIRIVTPFLGKAEFKNHPIILSSVGRWIGEEQGIIGAAKESGHPIVAVIYLRLDEQTLHERWAESQRLDDRGGRADDAQEVLETRIKEFNEKTLPVIEVYRKLGILIEVNSNATKREVIENILARLLVCAIPN